MAFTKISNANVDAYVSFGESVKIVVPGSGAVELTKDSFVKLLDYFRSYKYLLANQELHNHYYNSKLSNDLGYFVESSDGTLIIVDIKLNTSGKFADVEFKTLDTKTASVARQLFVSSKLLRSIVDEAAIAGIESKARIFKGIKFVDSLPSEVSAQRNVVYRLNDKFYVLNDPEDALDEIKVVAKQKLPDTEVTAKENVIYNLTKVQEEPDDSLLFTAGEGNGQAKDIHFDTGAYIFNAANLSFELQDLKIQKVQSLPAVEKAKENTIYILTQDMKVSDTETKDKGTAWVIKNKAFVEETRPVENVKRLPFVRLAQDGTYYLVENYVSLFKDGAYKKIGKVFVIRNGILPDVSKIQLDPDYIYTIKNDDETRKAFSSWIFDTEKKEFVQYIDPTETKPSNS